MTRFLAFGAALAFAAAGASAMAGQPTRSLSGTEWRLVRFQSSEAAARPTVPPHVERYVLRFSADGTLFMRLDCNRATARWQMRPGSREGGTLVITLTGMTRARSMSGAMDTRIAGDLGHVGNFSLSSTGLTLAVDGGIYHWEPIHAGRN